MTFVAAILLATGVQAQTRQSEEMAYRVKDQAFNHSQVEGISHFITDRLGSRLAASKQNHFFHRETRNRIVHGCAFVLSLKQIIYFYVQMDNIPCVVYKNDSNMTDLENVAYQQFE